MAEQLSLVTGLPWDHEGRTSEVSLLVWGLGLWGVGVLISGLE